MLLSLSGGGTKIAALIGILETLYKGENFNPQYVAGISAGAILTLPAVLGLWDKMVGEVLNLQLSNLFSTVPFNKNGGIKFLSYLRLLFRGNLGVQDISKVLMSIVTKSDFDRYKNNPNQYPDIFIAATNANNQKIKIWNLKDADIDYEKYIKITSASSAVPFVTKPIFIDGEQYFDGGLRYHNLTTKLLENGLRPNSIYSVYARPSISEKEAIYRHSFKNVISFTINTFLCSISENNEEYEQMYCESNGIDLHQIFVEMETGGFYLFDNKVLKNLYELGKTTANNIK